MVWLPFGLLGLSIVCVWLPPSRAAGITIPAFVPPFLAAVAAGIWTGVLAPAALLSIATLAACAWGSLTASKAAARAALTVMAALVALTMALHVAPGFENPRLLSDVKLSSESVPFTQYLNFDKGAAGLLLLAAYARRINTSNGLAQTLRTTALLSAATVAAVMAVSIAAGYVEPDFKLPAFTVAFLAANLLFTCVAEEAFFRGLVQERLRRALRGNTRRWLPVVASAAVFGLAHAAGGSTYLLLATFAGLGYALAYERTGRIEAPILVHFAVNATHFIAFSYPSLYR